MKRKIIFHLGVRGLVREHCGSYYLDVIGIVRTANFCDAYFAYASSSRHGTVVQDINGVCVFNN
jgi:hypothetical protein